MKNNNFIQLARQEYQDKIKIKQRLDEYYLLEQSKNGLKDLKKIKAYLPENYRLLGIRRGFIIAHLDFETILELIANGKEFSVVSGLNPSSQLHLGHKVLFDLLRDLQKLGGKLFIPITDNESYFDGKQESTKQANELAKNEIIPTIRKFNFDKKMTNIYLLSENQKVLKFALEISKHITPEEVRRVFGNEGVNNVGQMFYRGAMQLAQILQPQLPQYGGPKHTLIPVGIDQHPYILLARDVAKKIGMIPPSELVIRFQQSLLNPENKMSGSKPDTAIYLNDSEEIIKKKINRSYTGSVSVLSVHQEIGGIPEICSVFSLLRNNDPDDKFIDDLYQSYKSGELGMKELKDVAVQKVIAMIAPFSCDNIDILTKTINY